jgi:hypothetical protein
MVVAGQPSLDAVRCLPTVLLLLCLYQLIQQYPMKTYVGLGVPDLGPSWRLEGLRANILDPTGTRTPILRPSA